jgi:hypothetical protein
LDDLIYDLGPTETPRESLKKAAYISGTGGVRKLEARFESVDDLLKMIDEPKVHKKPVSNKPASKKVSKNPRLHKASVNHTPKKTPTKKKTAKKKKRSY